MSEGKRVLVAGGGITGLSAAYYLKKWFAERGEPVQITLVEKEASFGGKIATLRRNGFIMERGPDSFLARKKPIIDLTRNLGLEPDLVPTRPEAKKTYILRSRKLVPMPPGLVLGIPTRLIPFAKSGLLSPLGKARAAMDLILPGRKEEGDESIGRFIERRLGKEMLDRVVQPLLAGIYAGDCHTLSIQATFPQFHEIEKKHRSMMLGIMQGAGRAPAASTSVELPESVKHSMFLSYRKGLYTLVEALLERLGDVEKVTGEEIVDIARQQTDGKTAYRAVTSNGREFAADAIILALPAYALASVFPHLPAARAFGSMPYVSVANVLLGFERKHFPHSLDGSGFVVPPCERRFITACTWTSSKWGHTAPAGHVLLRCYVGRMGEEDWMQLSDEQIVEGVMRDVTDMMGMKDFRVQPVFVEVTRHLRSMPQYEVGHIERVARLNDELADAYPGVFATGSAFHGIGLPDCIRQGKETAEQAVGYLQNRGY
ncbi:protoporphyrinogen oxidase [Brevibacillus sp. SYP-B805]|uniref:protoporphyrinogen oxidase n=1 Tax=Brevibacillus sp. SYP-B805 TaxID=1578199 RepID=UPI0013ECCF19|nr:protoporphyrinogen oxidase [Brevibacillus sp. SYP-B805]NGQ93954.1 protoporphyrinogen oxidase [Brevibacillus sp. SYP-B805]